MLRRSFPATAAASSQTRPVARARWLQQAGHGPALAMTLTTSSHAPASHTPTSALVPAGPTRWHTCTPPLLPLWTRAALSAAGCACVSRRFMCHHKCLRTWARLLPTTATLEQVGVLLPSPLPSLPSLPFTRSQSRSRPRSLTRLLALLVVRGRHTSWQRAALGWCADGAVLPLQFRTAQQAPTRYVVVVVTGRHSCVRW